MQDSGLVADEPVIKRFNLRFETRSSRTTLRDYDCEKARMALEADYRPAATLEQTDLEHYQYPGRFKLREQGKRLSQRTLKARRADYRQAQGKSDQPMLQSGHFLTLSEHPRQAWNDLWLITPEWLEVLVEDKQSTSILAINARRYLLAEHLDAYARLAEQQDPDLWLSSQLALAARWEWQLPEQLTVVLLAGLHDIDGTSAQRWQPRPGETPTVHFQQIYDDNQCWQGEARV